MPTEPGEPGEPGEPAGRMVPAGLEPWAAAADELDWARPWRELYRPEGAFGRWFVGGRLDLAANCLERHLPGRGDAPAVLWEGEPGDRAALTYRELAGEVGRLAGALRGLGVRRGDRVALHLGWLPETVVAMLACARIGAVHTVVPIPLPAEALSERLADFAPKVLVTQDGAWRHGAILPLKARADEALAAAGGVECTVVVRRTGVDVAWYEGDCWWHELLAGQRVGPEPPQLPEPDAEAHLLAVPLANRRGRPVTVLHGTANVAVTAAVVHRHALTGPAVTWCAGDVSWVGAQVHGIYGPLLWGDPAVMYEGTLDQPSWDRAWQVVQRYGVGVLVTSPSVVRHLRGWAGRPPPAAAVASLRRIVTIGEPVEPQLRDWLVAALGGGDVGDPRVEVADGWGQVELGGIVAVDRPVAPARMPDPALALVDPDGVEVGPGTDGELVLRRPWAGLLRGLEGAGAPDATDRHWERYPGLYATGDRARRDPDGRLTFLGRVDEVISVSGQLVSLSEVREVLLDQPFVRAADVVERVDPRLGRSLAAAVVLAPGVPAGADTARDLLDAVREEVGGLARPRVLLVVDRYGDGLTASARRRALAVLAAATEEPVPVPVPVTWEQVLAAAGAQAG